MKINFRPVIGTVISLSFVNLACSAMEMPLVGEQFISAGEKVCLYGKAGRVAAVRMFSDDECLSYLPERPGKSRRVIIVSE